MADNHHVCITMVGNSEVGKTSLLVRFCKNFFEDGRNRTLGVNNYNKTIIIQDKNVELELWDTAGQEKFDSLIKKYFRKADGVLLVYDMTNHETFMHLSSWLLRIREVNEEATVIIVGNKSDLKHLNQVSRTTAETFARGEGLDFWETSAKDNENVDEAFENLARKVLERKNILLVSEESSDCGNETESEPEETPSKRISVSVQTDDSDDRRLIDLEDDSRAEEMSKNCCC